MIFEYLMEDGFKVEVRENKERMNAHYEFRYSFALYYEGVETYYSSQVRRTKRRLSEREKEKMVNEHFKYLLENE